MGDRWNFLGGNADIFWKMPKKGHSAKKIMIFINRSCIQQKFGPPVSEVLDPLVALRVVQDLCAPTEIGHSCWRKWVNHFLKMALAYASVIVARWRRACSSVVWPPSRAGPSWRLAGPSLAEPSTSSAEPSCSHQSASFVVEIPSERRLSPSRSGPA